MSGAAKSIPRRLPSLPTLALAVPECAKGVGAVIVKPDSTDLIQGVRIESIPLYPDDRGYFLEIHRMGRGLASDFPAATTQTSAALSFPGSIKAFHFHLHQTDCWTPVEGLLQVALVDLRVDSPTFGARNTLYVGDLRTWQILIPPGVGHGYKAIGAGKAMLVYLTNQFYNSKDEGRIPYNDSSINYDWETQHK